jgi:hypothetical protein
MPRLQVDWTSTLDEVAEVNGADRRVIALGTGASLLRMEGLTVNHIALTDSTVSSGWRGVGANADAIGRG